MTRCYWRAFVVASFLSGCRYWFIFLYLLACIALKSVLTMKSVDEVS